MRHTITKDVRPEEGKEKYDIEHRFEMSDEVGFDVMSYDIFTEGDYPCGYSEVELSRSIQANLDIIFLDKEGKELDILHASNLKRGEWLNTPDGTRAFLFKTFGLAKPYAEGDAYYVKMILLTKKRENLLQIVQKR